MTPNQNHLQQLACENDILICNIAYCLKRTRLQRMQRLDDVAFEIGTGEKQLRRLESGAHHPNLTSVTPLIKYYGLTVPQVFKNYQRKPTRDEWKDLDKWQKAVTRYHKSKQKLKPNIGIQLQLFP